MKNRNTKKDNAINLTGVITDGDFDIFAFKLEVPAMDSQVVSSRVALETHRNRPTVDKYKFENHL